MAKLTIEIPEKNEKTIVELIGFLGGKVLEKNPEIIQAESAKSIVDIETLDLSAIIFMKFGHHAEEEENEIIKRKRSEFKKTGKMFWGYGGNVCHPVTQIKPFVQQMHSQGKKVFLVMSTTNSKTQMEGIASSEYSTDKLTWENVPEGILVKGSKHAIVCSELFDCKGKLNLNNYTVFTSKEKRASEYIKGQNDKGCFEKKHNENLNPKEIEISLIAEVIEPYAVFMR